MCAHSRVGGELPFPIMMRTPELVTSSTCDARGEKNNNKIQTRRGAQYQKQSRTVRKTMAGPGGKTLPLGGGAACFPAGPGVRGY